MGCNSIGEYVQLHNLYSLLVWFFLFLSFFLHDFMISYPYHVTIWLVFHAIWCWLFSSYFHFEALYYFVFLAIVIADFLQYLPQSEPGPGHLILNRSPSDIFTWWRKQNQFPKRCVVISISDCVCVYIGILDPISCCGLWVGVSLIATWVFPWLLVFLVCVCGCACALVCMQYLCFLGFLWPVNCAVAGSLIATCVWLASRVYVCMRPGKLLCG
jgi:hypothetical protein